MRISLPALMALVLPVVAAAQQVYPSRAQAASDFELGSVVLMLMPQEGVESLSWDQQADGPIDWVSPGVITEQGPKGESYSFKEGLMRVNVLGKYAHVLKEQKFILAWTIRYASKHNPNQGVEWIDVFAGTSDEPCQGNNDDGCGFDPVPSLTKSGVQVKKVCESGLGADHKLGYALSAEGRQPASLLQRDRGNTTGPGGPSTSLVLSLVAASAQLCN